MSTFAADLDRIAAKAGKSLEQTRRAVCIRLFSDIIAASPVDTGRFRGNWQTNVARPKDGALPIRARAAAEAEILVNLGSLGDVVYFANNLPYALRLEEGYSHQAPVGMVRTNVARFERLCAAEARKNRV
jgi:hypothetical protein